jgi:hypothetical protein
LEAIKLMTVLTMSKVLPDNSLRSSLKQKPSRETNSSLSAVAGAGALVSFRRGEREETVEGWMRLLSSCLSPLPDSVPRVRRGVGLD